MAVSDPGRKEVDKLLAQLEKRITKQYKQATKELETKLNNYLSSFAEKDKKKQEQVKNGEITQKEYIEWRKGQILIGNRWKEMRDTMAKDLTNADKIAMNMVKDSLPDSYAISHNYGTYEAEKGALVNTSYTLYDRDTVKRLVKDNPDLLPAPKVDIPKDLRWNKTHLTDAITQGILQGEDIGKISRRLREVTDMDRNASIRNARTMTTSAENAGREDSYKRAEDIGIKMKQVWIATLDSRTRDAHRELDGQEVPVGEYFQNSVGKIRFPGDPQADPANVYNCRCTMIAKVDGSRIGKTLSDRQNTSIGGINYSEWKKEKGKEKQNIEKDADIDSESRRIHSKLTGKNYNVTLGDEVNLQEEVRVDGKPKIVVTGNYKVPENDTNDVQVFELPKGDKQFLAFDATKDTILTNGRVALNYRDFYNNAVYHVHDMIENEMYVLTGERKENIFYRVIGSEKEIEYIKKGTIRQSVNHLTGEKEDGLSVWEIPKYAGNIIKVSGEIIGFGSDGEPLLDVKSVKFIEKFEDEPEKMKRAIKKFAEHYNWTEEQVKNALFHKVVRKKR